MSEIYNSGLPNNAAPSNVPPAGGTPPAPAAQTPDAPKDAPKEAAAEAPKEVAPPAEPAKPVIPEKYDLKLSDGSKLPADRVAAIEAEAKEKGLTQEQAASLLARDELSATMFHQAQADALAAQQAGWVNELKSDPIFGGENAARTAEQAHRALDKYASPEFKKILNETQLGNYPELVKVFAKIGADMGEDRLVKAPVVSRTTEDLANKFYGKK